MARYGEGEISEGSGETSGKAPVSPKAPSPKAPTAYWEYLKVEDATEARKGEDYKGIDSKGKEHKEKDATGKGARGKYVIGKDPNVEETGGMDGKWKNSNGWKTLPTVDEDTGGGREYLFLADGQGAEPGAIEGPGRVRLQAADQSE